MKRRKFYLLILLAVAVIGISVAGVLDQQAALAGSAAFQSPLPEPPVNDNFEQAAVVDNLPYNQTLDASGATQQPNEPFSPCNWSNEQQKSIWYAYTPAVTETLIASSGYYGASFLTVYTGSSLTNLQ